MQKQKLGPRGELSAAERLELGDLAKGRRYTRAQASEDAIAYGRANGVSVLACYRELARLSTRKRLRGARMSEPRGLSAVKQAAYELATRRAAETGESLVDLYVEQLQKAERRPKRAASLRGKVLRKPRVVSKGRVIHAVSKPMTATAILAPWERRAGAR